MSALKNAIIGALVTGLILCFVFFWKNGKIIIASPETHNHTHQEQFQGQMVFNQWQSQGDAISVGIEEFDSPGQVRDFLISTSPLETFHAKIVYDADRNKFIIWNIKIHSRKN